MKMTILLLAFLAILLALGACVTVAPSVPTSPATGQSIAPGGESPLVTPSVVPSTTVTSTPAVTPTVVITASPAVTSVVPTAPPVPANTNTPVPTDTPVPEPTDTPTPEPPPTSTPTATATEGPTPTPTPLPNAVFVRDHRSVRRGSELHVVGEVANGSSNPIFNVTVSAAFFDTAGTLIGATEALAFLPQTLPTQNNPFKIILANAPASVSSYELALRWDDLSSQGFDRITIVSEEVDTDPSLTIHGEVRNDGFASVSNVAMAASFYDAAGHVLDAYPGSVMGAPIAPGTAAAYSVETGRADLDFDHFLVQAQGVLGR